MSGQGRRAPMEPFVISRTFDTTREVLWKAWTEPERFARWFGPKGYRVEVVRMDVRPGGVCHYGMTPPDGGVSWGRFAYRELVPPERIVFINAFADAAGNTVRPPFSESWPTEMRSTVTFTPDGGGTALTVRWEPWEATDAERATFDAGRESMRQGWTGTLDQLEALLAGAT